MAAIRGINGLDAQTTKKFIYELINRSDNITFKEANQILKEIKARRGIIIK